MHATSGNWQRGFALALTTALCWGLLPIALKQLLDGMDAITVTWYRLATAGLALGLYLACARRLPRWPLTSAKNLRLYGVALLGLAGNYVLYLVSLDYTTPTIAQIMGQISPIMLLFGGMVFFGERFARIQWLGFLCLVIGLPIFFHDRLAQFLALDSRLGLGVITMFCASTVWAAYALAQKQLLAKYSSAQVLFMVYTGSIPLLLPWSHLSKLIELDVNQLGLLAFCCVNTLVGYGCFAEALDHWEVSRVGAVVSIAPLITIAAVQLPALVWPGAPAPEPLTPLSLFGACLVVTGSMTCALGAAESMTGTTDPKVRQDESYARES